MKKYNFSHTPINVNKIKTKYRLIKTKIPVPESIPFFKKIYANESHSMHGQIPILWDKAEGFQVYDRWGNKWLDFTSTIFVSNAGHGNKKIRHSLKKILDKPLLHTYTYGSFEKLNYLNYLIKNTPAYFEKAFLLSSGTESTEAALKLMRLNGMNNDKKKLGIICFEGNWHGRTLGAQMMSGNLNQKEWIGYNDPNIFHLPFPYPWIKEVKNNSVKFFKESINNLVNKYKINPKEDICGFMLETFQGWGAIFYPKNFIKALYEFCIKNEILITFDEMQAGFGRTGKLFGYMHYDIKPDIICCGKGISSSLPLSIVMGSAKIMDLPEIGSMSSTHSANPLVCAAGQANFESIIEDNLIKNSEVLGDFLHIQLNEIAKEFKKVNIFIYGKGLIAGIIFKSINDNIKLDNLCTRICELCYQRGLILVHTGRESIKIGPPLMIDKDALVEGLDVLKLSLKDALQEFNLN